MDLKLAGSRALVFGSSSGLGRELAAVLSEEGARVIVTSRDRQRAEKACLAVRGEGVAVGDLTQPGDASQMVVKAATQLGGLDIVVINTGGGKPGGILKTDGFDDAAYQSMLRPVLDISRTSAAYLKAGRNSRLVMLTARSVVEATVELALSSVLRSGVAAAARSLALELAPEVNVNVIVTGQFATPALDRFEQSLAAESGTDVAKIHQTHIANIPLGRVGTAREFADVVAFICSPRASFVTGTVIRIDGGAVRGF